MVTDDIRQHLRPGDVLVASQVMGEPTVLMDALFEQVEGLEDLTLFVGMSLTDVVTRAPQAMSLVSSVGMGVNGGLIAEGRMRLVPIHMSQLPWLLTEGPLSADVALIQVSPPDADGFCSLGVIADYVWPVVQHARVVLAEVNEQMPVLAGDTRVHVDRISHMVRTDRELPSYATPVPTETELRLAEQIAPFVVDGTTIQCGIGRLPEALLQKVADRRDLGIHSGMVGDTLLQLMRDGVATGARKEIDTGLAVVGSVLGSARALAMAAAEPALRIRSIDYTHDPAQIGALSNFLCVNSALEVDLFGQINSETAGTRYVGGIGGAVDFLRGSVRGPGGHSVVALPAATSKGRSRIVPQVSRVTALGADVDVIVTEHGIAHLRGVDAGERAARLVAIAAPDQRDALRQAASDAGL